MEPPWKFRRRQTHSRKLDQDTLGYVTVDDPGRTSHRGIVIANNMCRFEWDEENKGLSLRPFEPRRPRHAQSGEADPLGTLETVTNGTSEDLLCGFWAGRWTSSGGPNAQCNSVPSPDSLVAGLSQMMGTREAEAGR
jgi:hypothetical protein